MFNFLSRFLRFVFRLKEIVPQPGLFTSYEKKSIQHLT